MTQITITDEEGIIEFHGEGLVGVGPDASTVMEVTGNTELTTTDETPALEVVDGRLAVGLPSQAVEVVTLGIQGTCAPRAEDRMVDDDRLVDFVDDDHWYEGWAKAGSPTADPVWKIRFVQIVNGEGDTVSRWAQGDASYNKVWDDRATYTY